MGGFLLNVVACYNFRLHFVEGVGVGFRLHLVEQFVVKKPLHNKAQNFIAHDVTRPYLGRLWYCKPKQKNRTKNIETKINIATCPLHTRARFLYIAKSAKI
jgi:hypothetical protein